MNEAMGVMSSDVEYIAIFDADFLPRRTFLHQTVPFLMASKRSAFAQTVWTYTNAPESVLTQMQEISLNYHFWFEQEMRFRTRNFFNFNGTAGVWRREAINDCGGWHTDTLVEDLDLSCRAWARGWDFLYLRDVTCLNEVPPTLEAYRGQQHRWTSGPMQARPIHLY
jgi:beta-mannan synthase